MKRHPLKDPRVWDYAYLFTSRLKRELAKLPSIQAQVVLDVGCGDGPHSEEGFASKGRIYGLDIYKSPKVDVVATAEAIPLRSETFDVVWMFTVLECVPDTLAAVGEMARVLKPGGHLLMCEHQAWQTYAECNYYKFTTNAFSLWAERNRLNIVRKVSLGSFWARFGIRLNRAILPYGGSRLSFLTPLLRIIVVGFNLFFGCIDRLFPLDGESVAHLVLFRKP